MNAPSALERILVVDLSISTLFYVTPELCARDGALYLGALIVLIYTDINVRNRTCVKCARP